MLTSASYEPFNASSGRSLMIAVPSRLYDPPTADKPLNGIRLSVKDNMDLAGLHTDLSCRAWAELYAAKEITATAVSHLTSLGATLVGKTKLSQFAEVESVTADWIDVHMPFNPRGDGYLTPDCSTSGGAAALATYPWLDASLGTDSKYGT